MPGLTVLRRSTGFLRKSLLAFGAAVEIVLATCTVDVKKDVFCLSGSWCGVMLGCLRASFVRSHERSIEYRRVTTCDAISPDIYFFTVP